MMMMNPQRMTVPKLRAEIASRGGVLFFEKRACKLVSLKFVKSIIKSTLCCMVPMERLHPWMEYLSMEVDTFS